MGYAKVIDVSLNLAFKQLKDLAVDCVLHKKALEGFDFSAAEVQESQAADTIIKAVVIEKVKSSDKHNSSRKELLFKSKGITDISMYDSVTVLDEKWKFGPIISDNGYIIYAEIFKEG